MRTDDRLRRGRGPLQTSGSLWAENPNLLFIPFRLASRGGAAVEAEILVEVSCRQDEEQSLASRSGFPTSRAVEQRGLK